MPGQRRIDRIVAPTYVDDLDRRSADELRAMRNECDREETGLSYLRRVLQGRIDILRAELRRRADAGDDKAGTLLGDLPSVLADDRRDVSPLASRAPRPVQPPIREGGRRDLDRVLDRDALGDLGERGDEELADRIRELVDREHAVSHTRRIVLDRLDAVQEELTARYSSGDADVAELFEDGGAGRSTR